MVVLTKHFGDNIEARRRLSGQQAAVRPGPRFQLIPNMWDELVCGGRPRDEIKYQHFVSGDNFILAGAVSVLCQGWRPLHIVDKCNQEPNIRSN